MQEVREEEDEDNENEPDPLTNRNNQQPYLEPMSNQEVSDYNILLRRSMRDTRMNKPRAYSLKDLGAAPMPNYTDMVFNNPKAQPASYVIKQGI